MKNNTNTIELKPLGIKHMEITIVGDSDLILNKMNDVTTRTLIDQRKDKAKDKTKPNMWEEIITSIHWYDGKPTKFSEETFIDALKNNKPCITAHGIKKSLADAAYRSETDKNKTKMEANVNVIAKSGLVPVTFTEHFIDEKIMQPQGNGSPVLVRINRFTGWTSTIQLSYLESVYSPEQLVNIVNFAGFGIGIGANRKAGYGRYHVESVTLLN